MTSILEILGKFSALRGAHFHIFQFQKAVAALFQSCFEDVQKLFEHCPGTLLNETA